MSRAALLKHYQRALAQWPKDTLRPDASFTKAMQARIQRRLGSPEQASPASAQAPPVNEAAELEQVNALFSLLENRYSKKFPLSDVIMKPKSNPEHYTNILKEIEETPQRSRFSQYLHRWRGFLRWK